MAGVDLFDKAIKSMDEWNIVINIFCLYFIAEHSYYLMNIVWKYFITTKILIIELIMVI